MWTAEPVRHLTRRRRSLPVASLLVGVAQSQRGPAGNRCHSAAEGVGVVQASFQAVVTRLRDAFLATNPQGEEGKLARELGALPLGSADELWFFLHPDGRLLAFNLFVDEVTAEFTEERDVAFGLRLGSDRYPELEGLLPERPAGAVGCTGCAGTGWATDPDGSRFACGSCHGRGWCDPTDTAPGAAADGGGT